MKDLSRRTVLGVFSTMAAALAATTRPVQAFGVASNDFPWEVKRTEAEWREMLTDDEYDVLRLGGTEQRKSHPRWNVYEPGMYSCKGCDLPVYNARWKEPMDIGFLFFRHSEPRSVMTAIDASVYGQLTGQPHEGPVVPDDLPEDISEEDLAAIEYLLLMEVHCRRCGSHLGHIVTPQNKLLHCINGVALNFTPQTA